MEEVSVPHEVRALLEEALFCDADEVQYLKNYTSSCLPQVNHRAAFSGIAKNLHVTEDIIRERIMTLTLDNDLSIEDKYLMNNYDGVMQMQLMTPPVTPRVQDSSTECSSVAQRCSSDNSSRNSVASETRSKPSRVTNPVIVSSFSLDNNKQKFLNDAGSRSAAKDRESEDAVEACDVNSRSPMGSISNDSTDSEVRSMETTEVDTASPPNSEEGGNQDDEFISESESESESIPANASQALSESRDSEIMDQEGVNCSQIPATVNVGPTPPHTQGTVVVEAEVEVHIPSIEIDLSIFESARDTQTQKTAPQIEDDHISEHSPSPTAQCSPEEPLNDSNRTEVPLETGDSDLEQVSEATTGSTQPAEPISPQATSFELNVNKANCDVLNKTNCDVLSEANCDVLKEINSDFLSEANCDALSEANCDAFSEASCNALSEANSDVLSEASCDVLCEAATANIDEPTSEKISAIMAEDHIPENENLKNDNLETQNNSELSSNSIEDPRNQVSAESASLNFPSFTVPIENFTAPNNCIASPQPEIIDTAKPEAGVNKPEVHVRNEPFQHIPIYSDITDSDSEEDVVKILKLPLSRCTRAEIEEQNGNTTSSGSFGSRWNSIDTSFDTEDSVPPTNYDEKSNTGEMISRTNGVVATELDTECNGENEQLPKDRNTASDSTAFDEGEEKTNGQGEDSTTASESVTEDRCSFEAEIELESLVTPLDSEFNVVSISQNEPKRSTEFESAGDGDEPDSLTLESGDARMPEIQDSHGQDGVASNMASQEEIIDQSAAPAKNLLPEKENNQRTEAPDCSNEVSELVTESNVLIVQTEEIQSDTIVPISDSSSVLDNMEPSSRNTSPDLLEDQMPILTVHTTLVSIENEQEIIDQLRIEEIPILLPQCTPAEAEPLTRRRRTPVPVMSEKNLVLRNIFKAYERKKPVRAVSDAEKPKIAKNHTEPGLFVEESRPRSNSKASKSSCVLQESEMQSHTVIKSKRGRKRKYRPLDLETETANSKDEDPKTPQKKLKSCYVRLTKLSSSKIKQLTRRSSSQPSQMTRKPSPETPRMKRSERRNSSSKSVSDAEKPNKDNANSRNKGKLQEFSIFDTPKPPKKTPHVRPYVYDKELGNRKKNSVDPICTLQNAADTQKSSSSVNSSRGRGTYETSKSSPHLASNGQKAKEANILSNNHRGSFQIVNEASERMKNFKIPMASEKDKQARELKNSGTPQKIQRESRVPQHPTPSSSIGQPARLAPSTENMRLRYGYGYSTLPMNSDYSTQHFLGRPYSSNVNHYFTQPPVSSQGRSYESSHTVSYHQTSYSSSSVYNAYQEESQNPVEQNEFQVYEDPKQHPAEVASSTYEDQLAQESFSQDNLSPLELVFADFAVNGISTSSSDPERDSQEPQQPMQYSMDSGAALFYGGNAAQASTESPNNNVIMVDDELQPVYIENVASYEEYGFEEEYVNHEDNGFDGSTMNSVRGRGRGGYKRKQGW